MTLSTWCMVLALFCCFATCGAAKNNKFFVKWDRMIINNVDPATVEVSGGCKYINRATKGLNIVANVKDVINETNIVYMLANKWINNNWVRYSAISFTETMKILLGYTWFDLQNLFLNHSTPPLVWPMQRTKYTIKDFVFNADHFPSYLPTGYYKAESTFWSSRKKEKLLLQLDWYVHLEPINQFKKN